MERRLKPPILIPKDEFQAKFKSKLDMHTVMSIDSKYIAIILSSGLFPFPDRQMSSCFSESYH